MLFLLQVPDPREPEEPGDGDDPDPGDSDEGPMGGGHADHGNSAGKPEGTREAAQERTVEKRISVPEVRKLTVKRVTAYLLPEIRAVPVGK